MTGHQRNLLRFLACTIGGATGGALLGMPLGLSIAVWGFLLVMEPPMASVIGGMVVLFGAAGFIIGGLAGAEWAKP